MKFVQSWLEKNFLFLKEYLLEIRYSAAVHSDSEDLGKSGYFVDYPKPYSSPAGRYPEYAAA